MSAEPAILNAGDTLLWVRTWQETSYVDYLGVTQYCKASEWTLKYYVKNATGAFTITASAYETDNYRVLVAPATSAGYTPGTYTWVAYVEKGTGESFERHRVDSGTFTVQANFATLTNYDARTHVKRVLDAIEAVIENRASAADLEYSVAGRSLKKMTHAELLALRDRYKAEYAAELAAERIADGLASGRRILVRFK